jgi:hypothetical protein
MNTARVAALLRELADAIEAGDDVEVPGVDLLPSGKFRWRVEREGVVLSGTEPTAKAAAAMRADVIREIVDGGWARRPEAAARRNGVVYFVAAAASGLIKIGFTVDLPGRLMELQTGSHVELDTLLTIPGAPALERQMHGRFAAQRARGEWFRREGDLKKFLEENALWD